MIRHELMKVSDLQEFRVREIRESIIEKLKERIKERGYNQAKSLTVVKNDGGFFVADGNHRLKVLQESDIEYVPCVIYEDEGDIYNLAVQANIDEDTYAPMDLFDWLDCIKKLKDEGKTLKEIAFHIDWEESKVKQYSALINKVTTILDLCKEYQYGRVTDEVTKVTFNFTERWFRDSGLYDLCDENQEKIINLFIADKFNWNKSKLQSETAKYKQYETFCKLACVSLVDIENNVPIIADLIYKGTFKTEEQLRQKINDLNKQSSNKLICGDSLIELENLDDCSIDLVITDPPYGIEYASNYSKYNEYVTKIGIASDGLNEALDVLNKSCEILNRKTKNDSHLYFFTGWKHYEKFKDIISKYFEVKNCIIWDKGNASMGDLEGSWGNSYEMIIFATKGSKKINTRKHDVINVSRVPTVKAIHPTQKPEGLIKVLLEVSSQAADTVCDPFMGSGSTIKAVKEYGNLNYIGIELDKDRFEKAKAYIGGA